MKKVVSKLLNRILEIENNAEDILNKAKENVLEIQKNAEIEEKELIRKIKEQVNEKLKYFKEIEEKELLKTIQKLEIEKKEKLEKLEKVFNENKDIWVEEIVFNVIKQ